MVKAADNRIDWSSNSSFKLVCTLIEYMAKLPDSSLHSNRTFGQAGGATEYKIKFSEQQNICSNLQSNKKQTTAHWVKLSVNNIWPIKQSNNTFGQIFTPPEY